MMRAIFILLIGIWAFASKNIVVINNPDKVIMAKIAKKSVNRVVLPSKILDVVYSKEKGMNIKTVDNQAFLKIVPIKKQKYEQLSEANPNSIKPVGEPKLIYSSEPTEAFFITKDKTYTFVFYPSNIRSPQVIIVNDFATKAKNIIKFETEDNYIKTLSKISKSIINGQTPYGYKMEIINKKAFEDKNLKVSVKNKYRGIIYTAYLFEISNKTKNAKTISPKFIYQFAHKTPKAITIFYGNEANILPPFGKAKVVLIEKGKK